MKKIPLTKGKYALVDNEDYEYLSQWRWLFFLGYAARYSYEGKSPKLIFMHRVIMNTPNEMETDHIDGDKCNNQKINLRICTGHQNRFNTKRHITNKSGYKGVSWNHNASKWEARIRINGKKLHLGIFNDKKEAAGAYNEAAKKYHGSFARLNVL